MPSPPLLSLALTLLRTGHGWTARALAAATGLAPSTISEYETGHLTVTRERLEWFAERMALGSGDVERAVLAAGLIHPDLSPTTSPVDPTAEERRIIEKAAALAGREVADIIRANLTRAIHQENARQDLEQGERLVKQLEPYSLEQRRELVEAAPDYQHWGLCVRLCDQSERSAAADARKALQWADLAVHAARHAPGTAAWRSRLEGFCTGFLANARRVANDLPAADADFGRSRRLWEAGQDTAGLLSEARLLDLEASLRRDQRRFSEALALHDQALSVARLDEVGSILLNKGFALQESGDYEGSIATLDQAALAIDGQRQPRLLFGVRFNLTSNLCRLGRASEALPILPEVRDLAESLRNDLDLVRTQWLAADVAAGLELWAQATSAFQAVRHAFLVRELPYDYALSSLDLALLYRKKERFLDLQVLAREILEIFQAQKVHREAMAAIILFIEAAEQQAVSVEMVRNLQEYLSKAQSNPKLRFEEHLGTKAGSSSL